MGYKDPEEQRRYQREWLAKRRHQWFRDNGPCATCGSADGLELHHRDPTQKIDHRVWSWSQERRDEELAKCQVLCEVCHMAVSVAGMRTTHCPKGHAYYPDNMDTKASGALSHCKICRREYQRQHRHRRK